MTIYHLILRSLRRTTTTSLSTIVTNPLPQPPLLFSLLHSRTFAFSSAEEAAAERRRRKRRLRIEPPLHALRRDPNAPRPPPDPKARRLPDTTSALTGPRLNLHNQIQSLIRDGDLDNAAVLARQSVFSRVRPTVFTCNAVIAAMYRAKRYDEAFGKKKEAWELFDSMLDNHTPPNFQAVNSDTFNIMVNECFKEGKFEEVVMTFKKVGTKMGLRQFAMDVAGYNNIIVKFAEHGMTHKAEEFFNELKSKSLSPDVIGYRTLIDAYIKEQRIDDALQMFNAMVDANLRVIPGYANRWFSELIQNNRALECSEMLTKLGERDPKPDPTTYEIVIKGLCNDGALDKSVDIIGQTIRYGVGITPTLREFLVDAFEKEGRREEIERVLNERRQENWQQPRPLPSGLIVV